MDDTKCKADAQQIIRRFCEAVGGTREELSKALGVTRQAISNRINLGDIPPVWFFRIADQYGASLDWLYRGVGRKGFGDFDPKAGASRVESMGRDFLSFLERKGASKDLRREVFLLVLKFAEKGVHGIDTLAIAKESIIATLKVMESLEASGDDYAKACISLLNVAFSEV